MEDTTKIAPSTPELTQADIVAAATNDPQLASDEFALGGRTFPVLYLDYDSQLEFMAYLEPLFLAVGQKFTGALGVTIPGATILPQDPASLLTFCKKDLPDMVRIICNAEAIAKDDESLKVDVQWIKKSCTGPFELVYIIMKQINKNQFISQFADFFVQVAPVLMKFMVTKPEATPAKE